MFFKFKKALFILISGLVFIGSTFLISRVFSYNDTITHPSLTENIAKIYNANSERKLTAQEIYWLKEGSIREDTDPRWMNHFYNPLSGQGLWGSLPSKIWAQDPLAQRFSKGGNQTWQKAIDSYAKGDNEEAFFALGHILHLLEDTTVPAHTRLDAHPLGDPYEKWVETQIGYQINFDVKPLEINQLANAFDEVAFYSNNYFLSKDTINIFELTKKDSFFRKINEDEAIECVKGIFENKSFCLAVVRNAPGNVQYFLDDPTVHSDYFSLLVPKAVSYGAGVIELFLEEAERQKQLEQGKSWWQKVKDGLKEGYNDVSSQFSSLFAGPSSLITYETKEPTETSEPAESNVPEPSTPSPVPTQPPAPPSIPLPPTVVKTVPISQATPSESEIQEEIFKPEVPPQTTEEKFSPVPPPQTFLPGIGGGPPSQNEESIAQPPATDSDSVSTTTTPVSPEVSMFLSDYQLTSRHFAVNWQSSSTDIVSYELFKKQGQSEWQEWEVASTSESLVSKIFDVPQDETVYSFRVRVINSEGIASDWQEISAPINFYPVVINEIAWAGTGTSSKAVADEWIELYNKTDQAIDLTGWIIAEGITSTTTIVTLQNQIAPRSYYLIERTDEETISDITADLAASFGGSGLSNSGERLRIVDGNSTSSQIIDLVDSSGGWPFGTAGPDCKSMERVNPYLPADIPGNWQSNNMVIRNGLNVDGQPINGTPKAQNSVFNLEFFYLYPAQNTTATSTDLKWTPSYIDNLNEYRVIRSFDAEFNPASTTIVAATTTTGFFDESLESETTYYYKISACDLSDYCVFSNIASTTTSEFPFSWAEPQMISEFSTSTTVYMPDIILVSDGTPAIIWGSSTSTEDRYIKFSKKNTDDNWSEPINISQDPAGYEMQILSKENRLEVLYSGWGLKQGGGTYFDVFSVRSENGVWQPPQNISQEGTNNSWAAGTIDSAMATHIVWQGLSQSSSSPSYAKAIFYRVLDSSGLFLGMPEEIPGSINGNSPNIIIDSQNKLYAFWSGCTAPYCDEIFYSVNNQDGSGWSEGQMIFDGKFESTISGRPQILLDENNQFLLAWQQRSYEIAVTKFDGLASTTEKIIFSKASKQASSPSLIVNNFKKPYVFWSHGSDTGGGIYFSWQKQNGQWQEIKTALEKPQPIMWARAAIDSNNIAHLVWGNDHSEIYYTYGKIE